MIKYAMIVDEDLGTVDVGIGTDVDYYIEIGMTELDVEQSEKDNQWYLAEKCPHYTPEEKEEIRKRERNNEIENKIIKLQVMALNDILQGNKENIKLYNEVISGLMLAKLI